VVHEYQGLGRALPPVPIQRHVVEEAMELKRKELKERERSLPPLAAEDRERHELELDGGG